LTPFHVAIISLGKIDDEELTQAATRMARLLRTPVEVRGKLPVPQAAKDLERGQFKAAAVMASARSMAPQLGSGTLVGAEGATGDKPQYKTDGYVFVTDVDLFTSSSDGVFSALMTRVGLSVVSVRRLRESFYRRKPDLTKQRSRLVKEMARMVGRLRGAPECSDPRCLLSGSKHISDLDLKDEKFCRACSTRLFEGRIRI